MTHESTLRVRYAETDQMQVVYHSNYLVYFETGRTSFLRALDIDYKTLEREAGCYLAVVDVQCRYKAPARFDDVLIIRTNLAHVRGSLIRFDYQIFRAPTESRPDNLLLTEGCTTHIVVGLDLKRTTMPPYFAHALHAAHIPIDQA